MKTKIISNLEIGDVLKRKKNYEYCELKQIHNGDQENIQKNYDFGGFCVREKILKKMFYGAGENIFIYNDEVF
jgi:hypothetical protein